MTGAIAGDDDDRVGDAARGYLDRLHTEPQRSFHFGIRFHSRDDFDATLDRVRAADDDPELAGRVALSGVFHPDEPGAAAPNMIQAFVRTDVVAAGVLAFGQHVELQWHLPSSQLVDLTASQLVPGSVCTSRCGVPAGSNHQSPAPSSCATPSTSSTAPPSSTTTHSSWSCS